MTDDSRVVDGNQAAPAEDIDDIDQLRAELHEARAIVDAAETKAAEYLDDLQRLKAEFENFQKRVSRDQADLIGRANSRLITSLLDVLDDFDLALAALDEIGDEHKGITKGIEAVYAKLFSTLAKEGLTRLDEQGVPFDPEIHEAVAREEGGGAGDPIVADIFRPGYRLGDQVLRAAMVRIRPGEPE